MAVTIPAGDVPNTQLATQITAVTAAITANPPMAAQLTQVLLGLQNQLVQNLIAAATGGGGNGAGNGSGVQPSHLSPATILSTCTVNT